MHQATLAESADTSVPDIQAQSTPVTESASPEATTIDTSAAALAASPFTQLGLAPALIQAVVELGYTQPTEVQLRAIPLALQGAVEGADSKDHSHYVDLMVSSRTGSGKTAAFLLPVLDTLIGHHEAAKAAEHAAFERKVAEALEQGLPAPKKPRRKSPMHRRFEPAVPGALVLCPTRELALQVSRDAIDLLTHCRGVRVGSIIGGMPYPKQIAQLQNANLVVATPGRLLDLQRSGQIKLDEVQFLVIDEADRMLDLGFAEDLEAVHQLTAQRRQTMMFSATFASRIQQLGMRIMHDGGQHVQRIEVASAQEKHENITQKLFWADSPDHKRRLLDTWLRNPEIDQAIVFASTQIECDALAEDLQQVGFSAVALHGALGQGLRSRRLAALRDGRIQILVATDVAARGIDVPTITHVFNYGLPMKAEDYTHRIGRTGRAGRNGLAITFAEFRDRRRISDIEAFTRQKFSVAVLPGLEPQQRFPEWRSDRGGKGRPGGPGNRDSRDAGRGNRHDGRRSEGFGGARRDTPYRDNRNGTDRPAAGFERREGFERRDERGGRDQRFDSRPAAPRFEQRPDQRPDQRFGNRDGYAARPQREGRDGRDGRDSRSESRGEWRGNANAGNTSGFGERGRRDGGAGERSAAPRRHDGERARPRHNDGNAPVRARKSAPYKG